MFRTCRNRNEVPAPNLNLTLPPLGISTDIDDSDLSDIPSQLRQVLETCLARDASPRVLEIYLPKVREIVINLLQGLKRKQARYRARTQSTSTTTDDDPRKSFPPQTPQQPQGRPSLEKQPSESEGRRRSPSR